MRFLQDKSHNSSNSSQTYYIIVTTIKGVKTSEELEKKNEKTKDTEPEAIEEVPGGQILQSAELAEEE